VLPEALPDDPNDLDAVCALSARWGIHPELARRLAIMQQACPFRLNLISGYRTAERQAELEREGRPTAPDALSTHRSCPATGADISPVNVTGLSQPVQVYVGEAATRAGLRWGGGSPTKRLVFPGAGKKGDTGLDIPSDWQHVDLGPRQQ